MRPNRFPADRTPIGTFDEMSQLLFTQLLSALSESVVMTISLSLSLHLLIALNYISTPSVLNVKSKHHGEGQSSGRISL